MCGIVGYIGNKQAAPILLDGLSRLEYRGYDSAGVAVLADNKIKLSKARGRLKNLYDMTDGGRAVSGTVGIGHTRWATHGEPSDINSHPHISKSGKIAVVHNGIIENYIPLKRRLIEKGFEFLSETDTEVIAHLFEYYYKGDLIEALCKVLHRVEGSYALGILCDDFPDRFIAVRKSSPLIVGLGAGESFIASDVTAILKYTKNVCYIEDNEIAVLTRDGVSVYNALDREEIKKEISVVDWDISAAEKGGYEHFMMKEIEEQPRALSDTISPRIQDGRVVLDNFEMTEEQIKALQKIHIIACGSAYHAGMVGKYVIEQLTRIPVEVEVASEFRYHDPIVSNNDLTIVISQSGETADSFAALKEAKSKNSRILSVVNVVGSTIANASDDVLYTHAGPEIAVATTKAYSAQLAVLYLIALYLADKKGMVSKTEYANIVSELQKLPDRVKEILADKENVQYLASQLFNAKSIFFIGRRLDYAVALEGSLKLKEISYIHSEAYAAGELKHGTISLIEQGTPVVALATGGELYEKTISNIKEVKARGAEVLGIVTDEHADIDEVCDYVIKIPKTHEILLPSLAVIPLQLFGYYVASLKGCDIDKPRNLAKSVTVE